MTFSLVLKLLAVSAAIFLGLSWCNTALADTEIHVDNSSPNASDNNPGTPGKPLRTISRAAELADKSNKRNTPVKILVHPGTYRESVALPFVSDRSNTRAPIIFESTLKGGAVISGSDVWAEWKKGPGPGIYSHDWPYDWGAVPQPWPSEETLEEIVRRREMVFVNGEPLNQVLSSEDMPAKSFYVSEAEDKIFIRPQSGVDVDEATIEVAVRSRIFSVESRENVTVRGFIFQHDNSAVDGNAVEINNSTGILVEDNSFIWNNWGGLRFNGSNDITARRNVANHNGGRGMEAWRIKGLLFEENTTSFNNWRGVRGGFTGFAVAGLKHLRIHDGTYKKHLSFGNMARGFWCDFDCSDVVIEDSVLANNDKDGIFIEASQGPFTLQDTAICNNAEGPGVLANNSQYVLLDGNVLYGNGDTQIALRGVNTSRAVSNWESGKKMNLQTRNWTIVDNVVVGTQPGQSLIDIKDKPAKKFLESLSSDNNTWYNPHDRKVFIADGPLDFNGWKSSARQDRGSTFGDPARRVSGKQEELLELCKSESIITILSLKVQAAGPDSVVISWATQEPARSRLEYGRSESYGKRVDATPEPSRYHSASISGLKPETTYHFRVLYENASGEWVATPDSSFATGEFADYLPPKIPSVLTAIVISGAQVNLSWGPSTDNVGVAGYRVYRDGKAVADTSETYYSDTGLDPDTKYIYTVTSLDAAGNESDKSAPTEARTYGRSPETRAERH